MSLREKLKGELIDLIEWMDESHDTMVYRYPRYDNEIKYGARLIVRQAQSAVFVSEGQIADVFDSGTHTLVTKNIPILSKLKGWKYGFESPFKAEVYFTNTRLFVDQKWGTKQPVTVRDPEFGPVRLRAFGTYTIRVQDSERLIREIVGTNGVFTTGDITDQLRNLIVTRFSDLLGESNLSLTDLAARYNEFGDELNQKLAPEFDEYGLSLSKLLIENISLPAEVEQALDKRSSMGIIGDMTEYSQFQTANAMEEAAKNPGNMASGGMGMGMGFAMANQMGQQMGSGAQAGETPPPIPDQTKFYLVFNNEQAGPFDLKTLQEMAHNQQFTRETLAWKKGMREWQPAGQVEELAQLFEDVPPPIPKA